MKRERKKQLLQAYLKALDISCSVAVQMVRRPTSIRRRPDERQLGGAG